MINWLPRDLLIDVMFKHFTIYELGFIARVCKLWNNLQNDPKLYNYKISILLKQPAIEAYLNNSKFKTDCINELFVNLPKLALRILSGRIYIGQTSIVLPYAGRLYLMTVDPLFLSSQSHMHGIVKVNNEIQFFCASPRITTRRRVFRPYQLALGEQKEEVRPVTTVHEQLRNINAFPIAFESLKGWNNPSLTYYLLALTTPYLFVTKGHDLISIYSVPTTNSPLNYESLGKTDVYHFQHEVWQIAQEDRTIRIKVTQKTP